MIDQRQAGHLDPDTLSAFAEDALPAHEREAAYAHLAVCPDCRHLVQLAQPEVVERPVVAPAPRRAFAGWRWMWTSAIACAGIGLAALVLTRPATISNPPAQMARVEAPPAVPAPAQVAAATPAPAPGQQAILLRKPALTKAAAPPPLPAAVPAPGNPFQSFTRARQEPEQASRIHGALPPPALPPLTQPQLRAEKKAADPQLNFAPRSASPVTLSQAAPPPSAPAAASVNAAPAAKPQGAPLILSSQTSVEVANAVVAQLSAPLPGQRPVASSFASGSQVVAADSAGSVYFSADSGQHWTTVKAAWAGHAVQIASATTAQPMQDTNAAVKKAKVEAPVFALTTSTGERWTSPDGTHWVRDERVR